MNTLKTTRELMENPDNGVADNTVDGKCSGCGSCCSNVLPLSQKEAEAIAKYIKKHGIKEQKHILPTMIVHNDLSCPFRSATEGKCLIYPVRPAICRDFQCNMSQKRIEANKRMYYKKWAPCLMRETFYPKEED